MNAKAKFSRLGPSIAHRRDEFAVCWMGMQLNVRERRKSFRGRTYLSGQVAFNFRNSVADCLARNFTRDGAKIVFFASATIPSAFALVIPHKGDSRRARSVWRNELEAGVTFLSSDAGAVVSIEATQSFAGLNPSATLLPDASLNSASRHAEIGLLPGEQSPFRLGDRRAARQHLFPQRELRLPKLARRPIQPLVRV